MLGINAKVVLRSHITVCGDTVRPNNDMIVSTLRGKQIRPTAKLLILRTVLYTGKRFAKFCINRTVHYVYAFMYLKTVPNGHVFVLLCIPLCRRFRRGLISKEQELYLTFRIIICKPFIHVFRHFVGKIKLLTAVAAHHCSRLDTSGTFTHIHVIFVTNHHVNTIRVRCDFRFDALYHFQTHFFVRIAHLRL